MKTFNQIWAFARRIKNTQQFAKQLLITMLLFCFGLYIVFDKTEILFRLSTAVLFAVCNYTIFMIYPIKREKNFLDVDGIIACSVVSLILYAFSEPTTIIWSPLNVAMCIGFCFLFGLILRGSQKIMEGLFYVSNLLIQKIK